MKKYILWATLIILIIGNTTALSMTRQTPSSASSSSTFTVTYTAVGDNTKWAVPIEDTISGGCTPSSVKTAILHEIGESTTLIKTLTFNTPSSGICSFLGFWTDASNVKHDFATASVTIGGTTCTGSSTQSCTVGTCAGTQTRTCNSGTWGSWGTCAKNDANCGTINPVSSVGRQTPSSASSSSTFTVTYTAVGDNTKWAVPIEDTISGGCTPSSVKTAILHEIGESTTLIKTLTFNTPSSGICSFLGFWTDASNVKHDFATASVTIGGTTTCTNDCPTDGKKECVSTTSYKSCGNFDADICLEWSTTSNCPSGQTCDSGVCSTQSCTITDNKASTKCYLDDIYYYDNCANRKDVKEDCTNGCDGDTKCKSATNTTSGFDFSKCISGKDAGDMENLPFMDAIFNFDCLRIANLILIFAGLWIFSFIK